MPQCKSTSMQLKPKHQIKFVSHFFVFIVSELFYLSCKILASPNPIFYFLIVEFISFCQITGRPGVPFKLLLILLYCLFSTFKTCTIL